MLTPKIWRALNDPPATHPLFQRVVVLVPYPNTHYLSWAGLVINLILVISRYMPTLLFLLMPPILLIVGLTYGMDCALRVGGAISREHEHNTYSLLSLSPAGPLAAMWAMSTSAIYRNHDFMRLYSIVRVSLITGLVGGVVIAALVLVANSNLFTRFPQPAAHTLANLLGFLAILGALYIEYIHSAVMGVLVGMLVSTFSRSRLDANLWGFGIYLLLQTLVYALALLVGFTLLPPVFDRLGVAGDYALAALSLLRLGMFFLAREILIHLLWNALAARLKLTPPERDFVLR